jgi:hypothetical protein
LGERTIRARLDFPAKVIEVCAGTAGLRVHLRISGHFNFECVAVRFSDEADKLTRVVKFSRRGRAFRWVGKIAAQGNNALHACVPITFQQSSDMRAGRTNAGKVRRDLKATVFDYGE